MGRRKLYLTSEEKQEANRVKSRKSYERFDIHSLVRKPSYDIVISIVISETVSQQMSGGAHNISPKSGM